MNSYPRQIAIILQICSVIGTSSVLLQAQLAVWNDESLTGALPSGISADPHIESVSFSSVGGVLSVDDTRFALQVWEPSSSVNLSKYFEITLAIQAGYKADLTKLTFTGKHDATALSLTVRSGKDLFATDVGSKASLTSDVASYDYALTGLGEMTGTIKFRFYGTDASPDDPDFGPVLLGPGSDTMIAITGTTSPVPEPASIALVSSLTLFGFGIWLRCRKT